MADTEGIGTIRLRVVVDTNGTPGRAVDRITRDCIPLVCAESLAELSTKLSEEKFFRYASDEERSNFVLMIERLSELVAVRSEVLVSPDPKDNIFLALAINGGADCIVSGDKAHLLPLKAYEGIPIISPAEFLVRVGH